MEIIWKISSLFSRFHFRNPKKTKIVIFDKIGSEVLIKTILHDKSYTLLPGRGEEFYITIQIFFRMMKKIRVMDFIKTKNIKCDLVNFYYLSCIEYIEPRIVMTFIDGSVAFVELSKNYRNAEFITIQNGAHHTVEIRNSAPVINGKKYQYYLPHFVCFGQYEVDEYKRNGHIIGQAYPVGSLKAGYYRAQIDAKKVQCHYDICLISQYRETMMEGTLFPEVKKGLLILFDFLKRFAQENDVRYCIALCYGGIVMCDSSPKKEYISYQKIFGDRVELIERRPDSFFSSYEAIDSSKVSLTVDSTLGFEALGLGKKILFCNFTGDPDHDINCTDLCRINIIDYDLFSQKLKQLLLMEQNMYLKQTEKDRKYFMNYNPEFPAHEVVRQLIEKFL